MACCHVGNKPSYEPMLTDSLMHIISTRGKWVNMLKCFQNGWQFEDTTFQFHLFVRNFSYLDFYFEICSYWLNVNKWALAQVNGMAPNRWQAINRTKDDWVHWCMYVWQDLWCRNCNIMGWLGLYHGCWCPVSSHCQTIRSHGNEYTGWTGHCLPQGRISTTWTTQFFLNDWKKSMIYFILK